MSASVRSTRSTRSTPRRAAAIAADAANAAIAEADATDARADRVMADARASLAAADALIRLSRLGPEWVPAGFQTVPDWRPAPPAPSELIKSEADVRRQCPDPPRFLASNSNRVASWATVTPGKRKAVHLAQWLIVRFGPNSWATKELWSLVPFIRAPPDWRDGDPLPTGWTAHIDDVGREYYFNPETRTSQWAVPRADGAAAAAAAAPAPPSTPPPSRRRTTAPPPAPARPSRRSRRLATREANKENVEPV